MTDPTDPGEAAPLPPGAAPDGPVHPDDLRVERAQREFVAQTQAWVDRHALTSLEFLYIVSVAAFRQIHALCLMERRHKEGTT